MTKRSFRVLFSIAAVLVVTVAATGFWLWRVFPSWFSGERSNLFGAAGSISYPFNSYGTAKILARELSNAAIPEELREWAADLFSRFSQGTPDYGLSATTRELPPGLSHVLQRIPAPNLPWAVSIRTNSGAGACMDLLSLGSFGSFRITVLTATNSLVDNQADHDPAYTLVIAPGIYVHRSP